MARRNTTIALSDEEKRRLDQWTESVYGESETVPYGETISQLIEHFEEESPERVEVCIPTI